MFNGKIFMNGVDVTDCFYIENWEYSQRAPFEITTLGSTERRFIPYGGAKVTMSIILQKEPRIGDDGTIYIGEEVTERLDKKELKKKMKEAKEFNPEDRSLLF